MVSAEQLAARFAESGPALTTAERALADRTWTYGHIVVDEAQELSQMAWRALLRRVPASLDDDRRRCRADLGQRRGAGGGRTRSTARCAATGGSRS